MSYPKIVAEIQMYMVLYISKKFWLTLQLTKEINKLSALVRSAYILQEIAGNANIKSDTVGEHKAISRAPILP